MLPHISALALLTTLFSVTHVQSAAANTSLAENLNPTGAGCVDPAGYLACYQKGITDLTTCTAGADAACGPLLADIDVCLLACGSVQLASNMGCWLQSCWNELDSCAYQGTAIQYLYGTDIVQSSISLPNYPVADDAPGRCVCNLGDIWGNITAYDISAGNVCSNDNFVSNGPEFQADCTCCWESSILSNIINVCPSNDFSSLGFAPILESLQFGYNESVSDKCSVLSSPSACPATFSANTHATTFYNPGALPSGFPGTAPLSDLALSAGQSSVTSPPQGQTYVFSVFPSYITTIVAAAYSSPAGEPGTAGQTSTPGQPGTASSTVAGGPPAGTGSVPATTTTKSGGARTSNGADLSVFVVGAIAGMMTLALACL